MYNGGERKLRFAMKTPYAIMITLTCSLVGLTPTSAQGEEPPPPAAVPNDEHPFLSPALYPEWSKMTPEQGIRDTRFALSLARQKLDAISRVTSEEATYENVFAAYENLTRELEMAETLMHHLSSVMDSPAIRQAQETLIPEISAFTSSIRANEQLWNVIRDAAQKPWVKDLSPEKQRFVQQVTDSFKDSGADLPKEKKARQAEILQELSTLQQDYGKKVLDSTNAWSLIIQDPAELAGMPENWMQSAAEEAAKKGYGNKEKPCWLITLSYASYGPVMKYCTNENTRKQCWEGRDTIGKIGANDTAPIVARVMALRRELAELLGFGNFVDLQAAHRMVDSGDKAMSFVDTMMAKLQPAFERETAELLSYISRKEGRNVSKLNPWDRAFYSAQLAKERYDFDPETLRPYQEYENVRRGMFSIFQHMYNITLREAPSAYVEPGTAAPEGAVEVWQPDVKVFEVIDNKTKAHLGSFYMDVFPRSTKRAGAWVLGMNYGEPASAGAPHTPHLATLCANLTPPTESQPSLLSHYDVETLFHEFGHMMHIMLGDTELRCHMGTSVAWDFVELPSQMNENWTWSPEGMATYARHYKTGEPLPQETEEKLITSRYFMPATDGMSQLCLAKLDLEMHMNYNKHFLGKDLDEATNALLAPYRAPQTEYGSSIMRHLTHCITGGYAGGYYCYKWAEVLAADAFTRFKKEGLLNATTGASYRKEILSQGDSKPAGELYRNFMGRDPNPDALLQSEGLLPVETEQK